MVKDLSKSLELIDRDRIMKSFIPFIVPELDDQEILTRIVNNQQVQINYRQASDIVRLGDCIDYCIVLILADHVNYVSLGGTLYTKLKNSVFISTALNSDIVSSLNTVVSMVLKNKPSIEVAQSLFDIFTSRQVFNEYSELIALLLANVYCLRNCIGEVIDYDPNKNQVIIKQVEST